MRPRRSHWHAVAIVCAAQLAAASPKGLIGPLGACFSGCMLPLNFVHFPLPPGPVWAARIHSEEYMTSIVACMAAYCDGGQEVEGGWRRFGLMRDLGAPGVDIEPFEDVLARLPSLDSLPVVDCLDNIGSSFNHTIQVTRGNFDDGMRTNIGFSKQMQLHEAFGSFNYLLLGLMTLTGLGNRVLALYFSRSVTSADACAEVEPALKSTTGLGSRIYTWYKRNISTPAAFGYRHVQPWGILSIPTRLQAIIIFLYVLINVVFTCIGYDLFYNNMFWYGRLDTQLLRYVSDRTGIMSFYNMVLLWLLAGRNDVVMWITGWSYQSMNLFHRWTARVATLQAIVHSVGYCMQSSWGEFWVLMGRERYWYTGVYATLAMTLLIPLSLRPLRAKMYEFFVLVHIWLSFAILPLLWYHVEMFGYTAQVWICLGIWAFDRVIRIARLVVLSYKAIQAPNSMASVTASQPGLLRLTVTTSIRVHPKAGEYYFLYTPWTLTPWENHPFTLASWTQTPTGTELHFLIAPLKGWTGQLRAKIEAASAAEARLSVLLEGPYGHSADLDRFAHVLLLAGGSGIAGVLPYVHALAGREGEKRRIRVVWTAANAEYAADVLAHELAEERAGHIDLEIYLTREDVEVARDELQAKLGPRALCLRPGRPDLRDLVDEEIAYLSPNARLAILGCGPGAMMDDLRKVVGESYGGWLGQLEGRRLEYFEESFVW